MNNRTDLAIDNINIKKTKEYKKNNILISEYKNKNKLYITLHFNSLIEKNNIKKILKTQLLHFFNLYNINNKSNILIVGLGNISNTSDSIGPKSIKYITPNLYLNNIITSNKIKISTIEPGVLGTTGIDTTMIIKSINKLIKPNLIILIDSFLTNNINNLNKTLELNNIGITPGSGIHGNNTLLNKKNMNTNVLVIGIPTSLEYLYNNTTLLMSTSHIDKYVNEISEIIGTTLNELLYSI